jgi:small subunit ribosomal protein S17e
MGRIKTTLVKRTGETIYKANPDKFKADFEHNKKAVLEVAQFNSKKLKNVIVGYITHLVKEASKK